MRHQLVSPAGVYPPARMEGIAEEEVARLLKERSIAAWEFLFERHFDWVYRYALGRLFCREAVEDVAAAASDRALALIDGYLFRGRPALAWLHGAGANGGA